MSKLEREDYGKETISSLSYQVLLTFEWWYFVLFAVVELLLIVFKGITFPYPMANLSSEVVLLFMLSGLEYLRNFLGKKGNLTEQVVSVLLSVSLTIPVAIGVIYFLTWQTYVLRIEMIISAVLLVFLGLQSVLAGFCLITFVRSAIR